MAFQCGLIVSENVKSIGFRTQAESVPTLVAKPARNRDGRLSERKGLARVDAQVGSRGVNELAHDLPLLRSFAARKISRSTAGSVEARQILGDLFEGWLLFVLSLTRSPFQRVFCATVRGSAAE